MLNVLISALSRTTLLFALFLTPYLLIRRFRSSSPLVHTLALAGLLSIGLNTAVPILLHLAAIPITISSLSVAHAVMAMAAVTVCVGSHITLVPRETEGLQILALAFAIFSIMVIPFTNLAGIDTYKWQGLATNVDLQNSIPWLVHPVSLIGFTPRSYPSAQPLVLATVQILGRFGVDLGFFLTSLLSGITGIAGAWVLGRNIGGNKRYANMFCLFYAFSPVFMRYNHWATGRGFYLAVLPLFLLALVQLPRVKACGLFLATLTLLALSHKVGLVTVVLLPLALLPAILPLGERHRPVVAALLAITAFAALLLSPTLIMTGPAGSVLGLVRVSVTRFAWMTPAAVLGVFVTREWTAEREIRKRLLPAALVTIALAHTSEMYGAMMALPFVCIAATDSVAWMARTFPSVARPLPRVFVSISLIAALFIVGHRSLNAAPDSVVVAAEFLNDHDPGGPYEVVAHGRLRSQVCAYARGCPRFEVNSDNLSPVKLLTPPSFEGSLRKQVQDWTDYLRTFIEVPDIETFLYGRSPKTYYLVIEGKGKEPANARLLLDGELVKVYGDPEVDAE
ncbi:MAG: hypothetical protein QGH15_12075 [Kiritimatiellia bacterium]|nr:hypothetical protein [Kiritimatiellia bacterium]